MPTLPSISTLFKFAFTTVSVAGSQGVLPKQDQPNPMHSEEVFPNFETHNNLRKDPLLGFTASGYAFSKECQKEAARHLLLQNCYGFGVGSDVDVPVLSGSTKSQPGGLALTLKHAPNPVPEKEKKALRQSPCTLVGIADRIMEDGNALKSFLGLDYDPVMNSVSASQDDIPEGYSAIAIWQLRKEK